MSLRVAIVGSGPAGFYAAGALLDADLPVEVDMIDRLPTPWGLVRLGVAPDHPKLKTVSRAFERIAEKPGFRFLGNVEVGRDLQPDDLAELYDAVVYAVGAQTDRRLGIPGEDLPGSWSAFEFVAWYNGHPDYQDLPFDLDVERAVVIGNGNVALDVARMLVLTPEELAPTDTTDAAIDAITSAGIEEVVVLGRRGPAEAAFTPPELAELADLAGADVVVDPADLELDAASAAQADGDTRVRRNVEVLSGFAARKSDGQAEERFACASSLRPSRSTASSASRPSRSCATGSRSATAASSPSRRKSARRFRAASSSAASAIAGWRSRACRSTSRAGRCATTAAACSTTTGSLCRACTAPAGSSAARPGSSARTRRTRPRPCSCCSRTPSSGRIAHDETRTAEAVDALLDRRGVRRVVYAGWQAIDASERGRGEPLGRPRVKLVTWPELLDAAEVVATRT